MGNEPGAGLWGYGAAMTLRVPRFWPAMFVGHAIYAAFAVLTVRSVHESRIELVIAWLIVLVAVGILRAGWHFARRMDRATARWAVFGFYSLIGVWLLSCSVE